MKPITILGAGGLTGLEFIQLLAYHDELELAHITSDKLAGKSLKQCFPSIRCQWNPIFQQHSADIPAGSLVILAVPNAAALATVPKLLDRGFSVLDLSGAYRLHDKAVFEKYYKLEHTSFELMQKVQYGIPEMFREKLKGAHFIANPGCYATSVILPLFLLGPLREKLQGKVVIDSKSGVSGAGGRTEDSGFSFNAVHENFRAYKILKHQHVPEMLEYASTGMSGEFSGLVFTPHLLPVYRGILSTFVLQFSQPPSEQEIDQFRQNCQHEPFIRLYDTPEEIELRNVQNTNFLDIGWRVEGNTMVMVSALDNLMKGAAGQAMQNVNLMLGLEETKSLV